MAVATGYVLFKDSGWNTQQIYRVAQRVLDSSKLKFGGFNYQPVIIRIPSGYARTGAYIRQNANDGTTGSGYFCLGLCNFDTLGDRVETSTYNMDGIHFVAVYDTREFIDIAGGKTVLGIELLNPASLNPVGFMVWQSEDNSAIFTTQNSVTQGSISVILPDSIRTGDTAKVSRAYFATPLGLVTTRYLYSAPTGSTCVSMSVQIGSRKFIQVGSYLIDITGEV
jgi:hypothetical protein